MSNWQKISEMEHESGGKPMKIGEALYTIESRSYFAISCKSTLDEVAERIRRERQIRGIYVLDEKGRLEGYLSLGVLIRNLLTSRHKPLFHLRSMLYQVSSEKVADIMETNVICARKNDLVETVLDWMADRNIKEIPIVDNDRRIIAVANILDLWWLLVKEKKGNRRI